MKISCLKRLSLLIIALCICSGSPATAGQLGVNLGDISDWNSGAQIFTDIMKQARHFGTVNTAWDEAASVDSNGWPTTDAASVVLLSLVDVSGTYKMTFTGQATVASAPGAPTPIPTVQNNVYNSTTNTTTADVVLPTGGTGIYIALTNTKRTATSATNTGVTNIQLIRLGYPSNGSQLFTNPFITDLQYFSVLRAMDYLSTNNNPAVAWSSWHTPTDATQANTAQKKGGCYQYLISLANQTGKDIWINFPISADDNFVTQVALLVKNTLNAGLHVYIENSNEVWNFGFQQATTNQNAAVAEVNAGGSNLTWNGETNQYRFGSRFYARRLVQESNIFKTVCGAAAINTTIRPIVAWQDGNTYQMDDALAYINANYGVPSTLIYGIAGAPYMAVADSQTGTVSSILSAMTTASDITGRSNNTAFQNTATTWHLQNTAYEGGPGLFGNVNQSVEIAANRDPGITPVIVHDIRDNFWGVGAGLFVYFDLCSVYGGSGMWGLTENLSVLTTAKFDAIRQLVGTGTPPPTPTGLMATAGNSQVALSWTASSGATAYDVKRSTVSGSGYVTVSSPTVTSYTNTGLTNGTTYYFVVDAKNAAGTSGNSVQASATPTAGGTSGPVKINCGGPAASPFVADADFSGGTSATNWTGTIDTSAVTNPAPQAVYQSERYGNSTYTIGGLTANTTYTVRLHFCENYNSAAGQRKFNVSINGTNVLTNFDIYATTGAQHKANIQQFNVAANASGQEVIVFTTVTGNALVNGIEINTASGNTHGGVFAVVGSFTSTATWQNLQQQENVPTNAAYTASFWMKGSGSVTLVAWGVQTASNLASTSFTATSSWQKFTVTFNTGTNTQVNFDIKDSGGVAGTAYIDDCFMGIANGTNVLLNPGFESGATSWGVTNPPFNAVQNP